MTEPSAISRISRNIFGFFGAITNAVYIFIDSLFNPGRPRSYYRRPPLSDGHSGPRIGTLRRSENYAPSMPSGCASCR